MNTTQILKVLKNERECIRRQSWSNGNFMLDGIMANCDRNCAKCDLCLPDTEILEVYDFLINGYELMQKQGAKEYHIRCDTTKFSQEELDRLMGNIQQLKVRAVSLEAEIEPLSPDDMRKIMGMESTD